MEPSRRRSAAVTAAATFAILGCVTALSVWGYLLVNLINSPADQEGHRLYEIHVRTFLLIALVPPLLVAAGIRTAVGILQLRPWARMAAMVSAALALLSSLWLIAFRPFETFVIPEHFVSQVESIRQLFAISFVFMLFPVSVWWLFLFRMNSVKLQFEQNAREECGRVAAERQNGPIEGHKAVI
jgi:hypothetical protein